MSANLERWVAQLDRIAASAPGQGKDGDGGGDYARVNIMPWCTFLAFDIIGDLAFGAPFGMVSRGRDECESSLPGGPVTYVSGAESLNRRGEVSSTLGLLPELRPWARLLPDPFIYKGLRSIEDLHGIAHIAVMKRLCSRKDGRGDQHQSYPHQQEQKQPEKQQQHHPHHSRHDILEMLCRGKDATGQPMPPIELVSEALTQLIAGSDTVSNTACAVIYYILDGERRSPGTITPRLQAELDNASTSNPTRPIASHAEVRALPFLRLCIDEAMRLHSTSATGLPRLTTGTAGVRCAGEYFPTGTVLSVPSYTLHHDAEIWGPDVESFRPERWLGATARQRASFNPFSYGPRACVGQNVAYMELALIVGTAFRRYEFELYQSSLESHEGFTKKPVECWVGIRRRKGTLT